MESNQFETELETYFILVHVIVSLKIKFFFISAEQSIANLSCIHIKPVPIFQNSGCLFVMQLLNYST